MESSAWSLLIETQKEVDALEAKLEHVTAELLKRTSVDDTAVTALCEKVDALLAKESAEPEDTPDADEAQESAA